LWIGALERAAFFLILWFFDEEHIAALFAVWFAFKVAAKWEAWSNIAQIPSALPQPVDELEYLVARRRLAAKTYSTFVAGALINILAAVFAKMVLKLCEP